MAYKRKPKVLLNCLYCGKEFLSQYPQSKWCSKKCGGRARWERDNLTNVEKVKCLECGKSFVKLGTHVVQVHGYESAREYRIAHELNPKRGIIPEEHRLVLRDNVHENGTIDNLKKGESKRFRKGDGRASKIVRHYFKYKRTGIW